MSEARFEIYKDDNQEWRWRFKATNGETIAVSNRGYRSQGFLLYGLKLIKQEAPDAPMFDELDERIDDGKLSIQLADALLEETKA